MQKIMQNDKARWTLTLTLALLVVLWRVVIPTRFIEITAFYVILVAVLDLTLTAVLIFLNMEGLKENFKRAFTRQTFLRVLGAFGLLLIVGGVLIPSTVETLALNFDISFDGPSQQVIREFRRILPVVAFISPVIAAPIWEEIAFRMAGKNLIKNNILFVLITAYLFAIMHTFSLISPLNITYFMFGAFFALVYAKTNDIRVTMIVHFLWNLMAYLGIQPYFGITIGF
jgi:membrane protease YdiL (CAAX protease family)